MGIERYRKIVPDWHAFRRVASTPEPTVLRPRTGRIAPDELARRLEGRGFELEPLAAPPHFLRVVGGPHRVTHTLEHWQGLFYVQQAVTGLAAPALAPRPGEKVLDLCAAPGGKTTHMADAMEDRGCVVASDPNDGRLRGLLGNLYRLAHTSVLTLSADGRTFPGGAQFDRVLVDAPCSAEGNLRSKGGKPPEQTPDFVGYVTGLQEKLLRRAVELARPGGVVLYVTCTFAPEENEAVVARVLADAPVSLEAIPVDAPHAPGLTRFGGARWPDEMEAAWRIYPHQMDSGGLFMARLRKAGGPVGGPPGESAGGPPEAPSQGGARPPGTPQEEARAAERDPAEGGAPPGWEAVPPAHPDEELDPAEARGRTAEARAVLRDGYGVPETHLAPAGWMLRGGSVWAHGCPRWPLSAWEPRGDWRFLTLGLRALKDDRRFGLRPTNDGLRWLGGELGRRVVALSRDQLLRLLDGGTVAVGDVPAGSVALRMEGDVVGRGVVREGELRHEIPKARARRLGEVLSVTSASAGEGLEG